MNKNRECDLASINQIGNRISLYNIPIIYYSNLLPFFIPILPFLIRFNYHLYTIDLEIIIILLKLSYSLFKIIETKN